jgi:hypothetical protein
MDPAEFRSFLAYEYTKRKFTDVYGAQLPVWALLASGSTGGVRKKSLSGSLQLVLKDAILLARLLVILLSVRY